MTGLEFVARGGLEGMQCEINILRIVVVVLFCAFMGLAFLFIRILKNPPKDSRPK